MNSKSLDKEYDPVTFDVLKVKAEDLASQLTLRDLPVYQRITAEEFTSGAWAHKNKNELAPNIAEFTYRFNVICLWTQREILSSVKTSRRVQVTELFIKLGKKLLLLNNIHGAFAVVSALLSQSIYRLKKTWHKIGRHEKSTFAKLSKLFVADNNWERLRKFTDTRKTPCLPHLGIYLTDLMFIQNAMKRIQQPLALGERGQQQTNMDSLIRMLASFQDSRYDEIEFIPCLQKYLASISFDRDQMRTEEEALYQLSLEREPQVEDLGSLNRGSSLSRLGHFSLRGNRTPNTEKRSKKRPSIDVDPQLKTKSLTPNLSKPAASSFIKKHKKTLSHGDAAMLGIDNSGFSLSYDPHLASTSVDSLDDYLGDTSVISVPPQLELEHCDAALVSSTHSAQVPSSSARKTDSPDSPDCICDGFGQMRLARNSPRSKSVFYTRRFTPTKLESPHKLSLSRRESLDVGKEPLLFDGMEPKIAGILHRMVERTTKNKPALIRYSSRIYAELRSNYLFEYDRKSVAFHVATDRDMFKMKPRRVLDLQEGWTAFRSPSSSDSFELHHAKTGAIVLYRCSSSILMTIWLNQIQSVVEADQADTLIRF